MRVQCPWFIDKETEDQRGKVIRYKQHRLPWSPSGEEIKDSAGGQNCVRILVLSLN